MSEGVVATPASSKVGLIIGIAAVAVVIGVGSCIGVVGILMVAVQKSRDAAKRIECTNNLKQLGIAMHNYHDTMNNFPSEAGGNPSFYVNLAPFCEVGNVNPGFAQSTPVKMYLCPSRRTIINAPGKRDYGYAASSGTNKSVLNAPTQPPLTLAIITNANGTSNTLMLSHLWISPMNYNGGDPTDLGWATKNNARSINNAAKQDNDATGSTTHIGGPHPNIIPCLFVDGHVQNVPYQFPYWAQAWNYQNVQPFPLP